MRQIICTLLLLVAQLTAFAQSAPVSGKALKAGGEKHLAPLSIGWVYNQHPVGYANLPGQTNPTLFLSSKGGVAKSRGLFFSTLRYMTDEGNPVFTTPKKIKCFWGTAKSMPDYGCVFNFKGEVMSVWKASNSELTVARYNPQTNELLRVGVITVGMLSDVTSIRATELADGSVELVIAYRDGSRYRPAGYDDISSYYDGAGIYRGELPWGGVKKIVVSDFRSTNMLTSVTSPDRLLAQVCAVRVSHKDGGWGYVVSNTLGALAYLDKDSDYKRQYLWTAKGDKLAHPTYGAYMTSFPGAIIIGGEGTLEYYAYEGRNANGVTFAESKTILMENGDIFTGTLGVPDLCDWDNDGDIDIVCGNSEGQILLYRNSGTNAAPNYPWKAEEIACGGKRIHVQPGYYGVQGPLEAVWGYTAPTVCDWNSDGLLDLMWSDATADIHIALNKGTAENPVLDHPTKICLDKMPLHGTWRVKPAVATFGGRTALLTFDEEDALHLYWRVTDDSVEDGGRILLENGNEITSYSKATPRLGAWGRCKLTLYDWDGDGLLDLLIGTPRTASIPSPDYGLPNGTGTAVNGLQVLLMKNVGTPEQMTFAKPVQFRFRGEDFHIGQHANSPYPCLLGNTENGANLIVGCENGRLFFFERKDLTTVTIDERIKEQQ